MTEAGQNAGLAEEGGDMLRIAEQSFGEELDGDLSSEYFVAGEVDHSHPTLANLAHHPIGPEGIPGLRTPGNDDRRRIRF
jgi:hypothetical protein